MINKTYEEFSAERKRLQSIGEAPDWSTTASFQLLTDKNYLMNGETPRDMYSRVATAAGSYVDNKIDINEFNDDTGITDWGELFFHDIWKGWLSPSSTVLSNMGTEKGHPVSCLAGDSWINTLHEGGTRIKDISIGDLVLTHKGRYRKVTNVQTRLSDGDLYRLKVSTRMTPIKITGNHQVKTNLGWVRVDELVEGKHLIATNNKVENEENTYVLDMKRYVDYKFKVIDGMIYQLQDTTTKKKSRIKDNGLITNQNKPINEFVEVTSELAWAFGLWFAEGSHASRTNANGDRVLSGIRCTMNINETEHLNRFGNAIKNAFGVNYTVKGQGRRGESDTWANCNIGNKVIATMFKKEFGEGAKTKNIPLWMKSLPNDRLKEIIDGVYRGDGTKTKNTVNITLTNPKLVMSLYDIGLKAGIKIGLQMQTKGSKSGTEKYVQSLMLYQYKQSTSKHTISSIEFEDGLRYCPFDLKKLDEDLLVYDITVDDDESFSVAGVVVHNCSQTHLSDSIAGFYKARAEIARLTQLGYGTSWNLSLVRTRGSKYGIDGVASGVTQPMMGAKQDMKDVTQGSTRKGSIGQYLDVLHGDFEEVANELLTDHVGLNIGWNLTDEYRDMFYVNPEKADRIWNKMMKVKMSTGKGYFYFPDKVNRRRPQMYIDRGFSVAASNLCCEISLFSDKDHTYSCVLSSMNAYKYDEWKDTSAVKRAMIFLYTLTEDMLMKAKKDDTGLLDNIIRFTEKTRAVGLGTLGSTSYMQKNNMVYGDMQSRAYEHKLYSKIDDDSMWSSKYLARTIGEPEYMVGYGEYFSHRIALPPTKSTSVIMGGYSEGTMNIIANIFTQDTAGGNVFRINPPFLEVMKDRGMYTEEVMTRIANNSGSVQTEDWLTDDEKKVFRTAFEIDQYVVLSMAAERQKKIDQGQSINIHIDKSTTEEEISRLHVHAMMDENIHGLYYVRSLNDVALHKANPDECESCNG